jgi:hypothetical protein
MQLDKEQPVAIDPIDRSARPLGQGDGGARGYPECPIGANRNPSTYPKSPIAE